METVIIAGIFTLVGSVVSATIVRYGFTFWKRTKRILVSGELSIFKWVDNEEILDGDGNTTQTLDDGEIDIKGRFVSFKGRYVFKADAEILISGEFKAKGEYIEGVASLSYVIDDKQREQHWNGSMILDIPSWGEINGYYITPSIIKKGKTVLGKIRLCRT